MSKWTRKRKDVPLVHVMFKRILNLFRSKNSTFEKQVIDDIRNSPHFEHIKIGERGSLHIDKDIIYNSKEYQEAMIEVEKLRRRNERP